ncbi:MAG: hypothetical protein V4606_01530 [Patescibacteria group bacterium]
MKITEMAIEKIREAIVKPLGMGELRQIVDLGNLYVSLQKWPEDDDGYVIHDNASMSYWFQYDIKIDGIKYYFYGGDPILI